MRRVPLMLLLLAGAGCQPDADPDPIPEDRWDDYSFVWEGEHATVYGYDRAESEVCAGSFAALELHTRAAMDLLGVDSLRYDYRWLSDAVWDGACSDEAGACTVGGEPRSRSLPHLHEVTHAVAAALPSPRCASLLAEGLAEYLGDPWPSERPLTDRDIREGLGARRLPVEFYGRAGHFVSFLIERWGPEAFVELCDALPYGSELSDWERAIPDALGLELDALLAEYGEYPECSQSQYRARLWECAGEPDFELSAEHPVVEFHVDCADARAMNGPGDRIVVTRKLWVPDRISFDLSYGMDGGGSWDGAVIIQQCAPCSAEPQVVRLDRELPVYGLEPGMHELIVVVNPSWSDGATVRLEWAWL